MNRKKSCLRKVRYGSLAKAREAALRNRQRHYGCNLCGGWHLTNSFRRGSVADPKVWAAERSDAAGDTSKGGNNA